MTVFINAVRNTAVLLGLVRVSLVLASELFFVLHWN